MFGRRVSSNINCSRNLFKLNNIKERNKDMKDLFSLFSSLARKHLPSRSQHVQFFLTKLETVSRNVHINVIVLFFKKKLKTVSQTFTVMLFVYFITLHKFGLTRYVSLSGCGYLERALKNVTRQYESSCITCVCFKSISC